MTAPHPNDVVARSYTVGVPPHVRSLRTVAWMHYATIAALVPVALAGAVGHAFGERAASLGAAFGPMNGIIQTLVVEMGLDSGVLWFLGILGTVALGLGAGALVEYVVQILLRQPYRAVDGHGALMGMLLALMMPPTVPWWVLLVGIVVTIFLGKQLFGGLGGYPMHPAAVGWLVLLLSWPNHLYPVGSASVASGSGAAIVLTIVGGVVLSGLGYARPQIWLGVIVGVVVFSLAFAGRLTGGPLEQLATGHVMLGAFFLATDPTVSPANRRGMWLYGLGAGFLIMLIRAFGVWPDAVPFAVLLMNVMSPLLDKLRPPVRVLGGTA